jgi:hypothetical protein
MPKYGLLNGTTELGSQVNVFILLATFDPDPTRPHEIWAFNRQTDAEEFLRGLAKDYLGGYTHDADDLPPDAELVAVFRNADVEIHLYACHLDGGSTEIVPFARAPEPQPQL